jgi:uncharacterized protein YbjT (DUF2867 family)
MAENKITGHIIVESDETLRAFEREIHSLEQAFRDSGFDGADLDMSLAYQGEGAEQRGEAEAEPFYSARLRTERAASLYDAASESADAGFAGAGVVHNGRLPVNMLV